ncbi:MAG: maleylpyruvate isomerase N-terminal domain-containing protein [Dehalococcoidia bacterium]
MKGLMTKADVEHEVLQAWESLASAVDSFSDSELEQPGVVDDWTVKDLLGHIAFWSQQGARNLQVIVAGEDDKVQRPDSVAVTDEWNERERKLRGDRSLSALREEWLDSFQAAMQALADCPPEKLDEQFRGRSVRVLFAEDTYEHYREHLAHLNAWRREMETTEE